MTRKCCSRSSCPSCAELRPGGLAAFWTLFGDTPHLASLRLFTHRTWEWGGAAGWLISFERDGILVERLPDAQAPVTDARVFAELAALPAEARARIRFGRCEGTPLDEAALRRILPATALPVQAAAKRKPARKGPPPTFQQLVAAIKARDVVKVEALLSAGAPVSDYTQHALLFALGVRGAGLGHEVALAIVRLLLDHGVDAQLRIETRLPLTWAFYVFEAEQINHGVATLLLERGALPDEETLANCVRVLGDDDSWLSRLLALPIVEGGAPGANRGWTALHYAALSGSKAAVVALLAAGASKLATSTGEVTVRLRNGKSVDIAPGATPAHVAQVCRNAKLVPLLSA